MLPLHIFEPRYRQMVEDSLRGDRRIGMVMQKRGGEEEACAVGGLGEISECERLDDGRFNLMLAGRTRFRVIRWLSGKPYRRAQVRLVPESVPESGVADELSRRLIMAFHNLKRLLPESFDFDLLNKFEFPTLVNSICSSLQIDCDSKQHLLEMDRLQTRAETILEILERLKGHEEIVAQFEHLRPDDPATN